MNGIAQHVLSLYKYCYYYYYKIEKHSEDSFCVINTYNFIYEEYYYYPLRVILLILSLTLEGGEDGYRAEKSERREREQKIPIYCWRHE